MIVAMSYFTLACMKEDKAPLLDLLQSSRLVMLTQGEGSQPGASEAGEQVQRMERLMQQLKPYAPKRGMLSGLPEESAQALKEVNPTDQQAARRMEELLDQLEQGRRSLEEARQEQARLSPWRDLDLTWDELQQGLGYTRFRLGILPATAWEALSRQDTPIGYTLVSQSAGRCCLLAAAVEPEGFDALPPGWEPVGLSPWEGTPAQQLNRLEQQIQALEKEQEQLTQTLKELAADDVLPARLTEQYRAKSQRESAPCVATQETVLLEGWIPKKKQEKLEKLLNQTGLPYGLDCRDPLPEESPPTLLENSKTVRQFEGITNMFSVPNYHEGDPNGIMAPWYWLIFGMMMGDVGYGAMMVVLILLVKKFMKLGEEGVKLMNVMLYSSITTMLCGVVFGSYFGETWHPLLFSPMEDPVSMLLLTLLVGVAHIFTGLGVKIYRNVRQGKVLDALFDQVSWILLIAGLGLLFLPATQMVGGVLAVMGALIILFTAGRDRKGLVSKAVGGLSGLYGITSYLSDILSYSRILALSLATGVVGMVMNMLAGMIQGSVIGWILSLAIYAAGHIFNLALSLLSAYVHDCRLQYIEFYGKFYEGGGTLFRPFSIDPHYLRLKKDGGN